MTQEFHLSVTPVGEDEYLIRTERVAPGVPLAEEQVVWPVEAWLNQARQLMNDPLLGLLQGDSTNPGLDKLRDPSDRELDLVLGNNDPSQSQPPRHLVDLGQQLYNALFQGTIRDSWMTAQGIAQHRREVLRLRLGLKGPRLVRLPWEVLHTGERHRVGGASRPVATGTDVLFSRYQPSPGLGGATTALRDLRLESQQPLRILMAIAAPTDQEQLELKREALHLQEELRSRNGTASEAGGVTEIQLTILDQPDREQLTQALEQGQFQVLHYAGHSNLGAAGGNLYLVNGKTGLTEVLSGDDLAGLLVNNGIRMVVFNSCRSAYTATSDLEHEIGEQNLAEALVRRGIPGVLAMAERIPDDVALTLTRLFYRNLKQGYPVDLSLSRARQGLISAYGSHQLYWALPILYLHPEFDGQLVTGNVPDLYSAAQEMATARWRSPSDRPSRLSASEAAHLSDLDDDEAFLAPSRAVNGLPPELQDDPYDYGDEDFADLDDLEFEDDFGSEADSAIVAELIQQISVNPKDAQLDREEPLLPAAPSEDLLGEPPRSPVDRPNAARPQSSSQATPLPKTPSTTNSSPNSALDPRLSQVFSDLERGLVAPANPSTAIATARKAIQVNPNDVDAYNQLGLALYRQGNYSDAIAAYEAALKINPSLGEVYSNLALALHKQGKVAEARTAYQQAVSLSALAGGPNPTTGRSATSQPQYPRRHPNLWGAWWQNSRHSGLWLILAAAGATAIALFCFWWFQQNRNPQISIPKLPESSPNSTSNSFAIDPQTNQSTLDLKATNTATVTAAAIDYLSRKQLVAGQQAIAELLDRGALPQASAALAAVPNTVIDDPAVSFLRGRLAWQSMQTGNQDYSVDDARRYWETAVRQQAEAEQPSAATLALYQNALGFAYYAEGNWERANRAWFQALYLQEETQTTTLPNAAGGITATGTSTSGAPETAKPANQENLMAYAGLALVLAKSAQSQPTEQRTNLQNEAAKLYQKVMAENPVAFQPDALSKNWMWTETAIKDWAALAKLQPPS